MKIKTFQITEYAEATKFIEEVVLTDSGVQFSESMIAITYYDTKENYEETYIEQLKDGLKRNLFHEAIRKTTIEAEYEYRKEKGTNQKGFDDVQDKVKETTENIAMFEAKLEALEAWNPKKS